MVNRETKIYRGVKRFEELTRGAARCCGATTISYCVSTAGSYHALVNWSGEQDGILESINYPCNDLISRRKATRLKYRADLYGYV